MFVIVKKENTVDKDDFIGNGVTLPRARMHMHNPLFCLKHHVVGFVCNRFIYKTN